MTTETIPQVAGLFATRENPDTLKKEVFLVLGAHGAWHFVGGHVESKELVFEDFLLRALRREIKEEIGIDFQSAVTKIDSGIYTISNEVLEIHTYTPNTPLDTSEASLQSDREVSDFEWTSTPHVLSDGSERPMTPHTKHILDTFFK